MMHFVLLWFCTVMAGPPTSLTNANWEILEEDPARVRCTRAEGLPWCQSETVMDVPSALLEKRVREFAHYPEVFLRVRVARELEPDIVLIVLDMPYPLADRDYVAHFQRAQEGNVVVYSWSAVRHRNAPPGEPIRLPRAAGSWRFEAVSKNQTRVTYTWNGELLGDFPDWALSRAWVTQGLEVLDWLEQGRQQ